MTADQKELIKKHQYASIKFENSDKMPAPAYCKKGRVHYEVYLAKEFREDKSKKKFLRTLLLHELGHLECRHLDINYDDELEALKQAQIKYETDNNIPEKDKREINLSMALNIAGDLEVNSKYLTFGDIKFLTEQGYEPITLKSFNTTFKEKFSDYYYDVISELYRRPATPVIIMDVEASVGSSGGSGKKSEKSDSEQKDTVTGVLRSSCDDYDKEMSDSDKEGEESDKKEESDNKDSDKNQGSGNSKCFYARSKKETEEELTKLLLSIKEVKRSKQLDQLRLYNRGTRRNKSGVLYTSVKRKTQKSTEKLGVLIDVSGSMNITSVLKSLETISRVALELHRDTKVKCWQSDKSDEFYVDRIPERIRAGGGTYLPAGLQEFLDEGYDNIVVYSDFCDTLEDYIKILDENPCKIYLVSTQDDKHLSSNSWLGLKERAVRVIYTSEA